MERVLPKTEWGAKLAVMDFRARHGISNEAEPMRDIDGQGAYWVKVTEPALQREAYLQALRAKESTSLQPAVPLGVRDYARARREWERLESNETRRKLEELYRGALGTGSPKRMSKTFEPIDELTAMSPKPCFAT